MTNKNQELDELFSMFHDFDIISAEQIDDNLILEISVPWDSIPNNDNYFYIIKVELIGCKEINCDYWVLLSKNLIKMEDNSFTQDLEQRHTINPKDLKQLELSVQYRTFHEPNKYELYCIGEGIINTVEFATLTITADDYRIFDQDGNPISLETMQKWCKGWWDDIQLMWDKQKEEADKKAPPQ